MMTSALALLQVFTLIVQHGNESARFLAIAAEKLKISGEAAEADALGYLIIAIKRVKSDIACLPFDSDMKGILESQIGFFNPILDMSQVHLDLNNCKRNFFSHQNINNLMQIHMALAGFRTYVSLDKETMDLRIELREIGEEVAMSALPEPLRSIVARRLFQLASALDHFIFFGSEFAEEAVGSVSGALALNLGSLDKKTSMGIVQKVVSIIRKANKGLSVARTSADNAAALIEGSEKLFNALSDFN